MNSSLHLTVVERPGPTSIYLFDDAMADARGNATDELDINSERAYDGTNHTLTLWNTGCLLDNGLHNCTASCKDPTVGPKMVWNSTGNMTTLQNCLIYPILSRASQNGWLTEGTPGLLDKYNIIVSNASQTGKPNVEPQGASEWPVINNCMQRMCHLVYKENDHYCEAWGRYQTNFTIDQGNASWSSLVTNAEFCSMGQKSLNADIGGRGVMYSYIQQLSLILLAWLILFINQRIWKICWHNFGRLLRACMKRLNLESSRPIKKPVVTDETPVCPNLHHALITALYDFQRTQIFFSMTLQVAAFIVAADTTWLDAVTVPELKIGVLMFEIIGSMGIFPLGLTLIILLKDKKSLEPFISVASTIAMGLALGVYLKISLGNWKPGKLRQTDFNPDECGHLNPLQHCIGDFALKDVNKVLERSTGEQWMRFIVVLLLLLGLCVGVLEIFRELLLRIQQHRLHTSWQGWFRTRLQYCSPWIEFILLCANCSTMSTLSKIVDQIPLAKWSLGQCLAVAIWAPFVIDFFYLLIRGVKESFTARLAHGYRVIKDNTTGRSLSLPAAIDGYISTGEIVDGRHHDASSSSYGLLPLPPDPATTATV